MTVFLARIGREARTNGSLTRSILTIRCLFPSYPLFVLFSFFFLSQCAIGQLLTKSNKRNSLIGGNYGAKFENLEGFECKQIARKLNMSGISEPCVKRSKIEKRFYNAKRKEKPCNIFAPYLCNSE